MLPHGFSMFWLSLALCFLAHALPAAERPVDPKDAAFKQLDGFLEVGCTAFDTAAVYQAGGAEKLLGRGDMLYQAPDAPAPIRLQGVFVSDHEIQKLVEFWRQQAGAVPVTWLQVMLEMQRDWARSETYEGVMEIAKEHAGAYGIGIEYAHFALGKEAKKAA